jgi:hypothetical protein
VLGRFGARARAARPASPGTGVIAGGGVRAVLELAGIRDVLAKSLGTTNPINMLKAAETALRELRRPEDVAKARGKSISDVLRTRRRARGGAAAEEPVAAAPPSRRPEPEAAAEPEAETAPRSRRGGGGRGWRGLGSPGSGLDRAVAASPRHARALGLGRIGKTAEHDEVRFSLACLDACAIS